jgi:hypothetical protein
MTKEKTITLDEYRASAEKQWYTMNTPQNTTRLAFFGPTEMCLMGAQMQLLVYSSIEFSVLDDRGGSGSWVIRIPHGTKQTIPALENVEFYSHDQIATPWSYSP